MQSFCFLCKLNTISWRIYFITQTKLLLMNWHLNLKTCITKSFHPYFDIVLMSRYGLKGSPHFGKEVYVLVQRMFGVRGGSSFSCYFEIVYKCKFSKGRGLNLWDSIHMIHILTLIYHKAGQLSIYLFIYILYSPEIVPPLQGDEVTEPLVRQLVRDHGRHPLLVRGRGLTLVVQQVRLSR